MTEVQYQASEGASFRLTLFPDFMSTQGYTVQCRQYATTPEGVVVYHRNGDVSVFPWHGFRRLQVTEEH